MGDYIYLHKGFQDRIKTLYLKSFAASFYFFSFFLWFYLFVFDFLLFLFFFSMTREFVHSFSLKIYLYLHLRENLVIFLVSLVLDSNNYHSWNRYMITSLTAKNRFGFINRTTIELTKEDSSYQAWKRCNNMVVLWRCIRHLLI